VDLSNGRPLRVLHVITKLTGGGAENFVCALVPAFDPRVVQAGLMSVYATEVPLDAEAQRRIPMIRIERQGRYDRGFLGRMIAGIRQFRPDIVHTHLHNGKYWGRLTAMLARVPIVLFTEHNPCGEIRIVPEIAFDWVVNKLTDGIVTFADQQRTLLARAEGLPVRKVIVIENGITLPALPTPAARIEARRRLGVREDEFVVVVVARLVARKNQRLAIETAAQLSAPWRGRMRFFFIGSGEDEQMLRELAITQGVADRIAILGNRDDAVELIYGADVFYMPSLAEGMPLAILEAMSVGLPIVSTPWIGVAELLQHGQLGTILADFEPRTSAAMLERIAENPEPFAEIASGARDFVRHHHDIARVARLHEQLYRELAIRRGTLDGEADALQAATL